MAQYAMPTGFVPALCDCVRDLLCNRPRTLTLNKIAEDTGLQRSWLSDFLNNPEREHSCNKVETLYAYLAGKAVLEDSKEQHNNG